MEDQATQYQRDVSIINYFRNTQARAQSDAISSDGIIQPKAEYNMKLYTQIIDILSIDIE